MATISTINAVAAPHKIHNDIDTLTASKKGDFSPPEHSGVQEKNVTERVNEPEKALRRPDELLKHIEEARQFASGKLKYEKTENGEDVLRVYDKDDNIIRQLPPEVLLRISQAVREFEERQEEQK